jgi:hypothetical protein
MDLNPSLNFVGSEVPLRSLLHRFIHLGSFYGLGSLYSFQTEYMMDKSIQFLGIDVRFAFIFIK